MDFTLRKIRGDDRDAIIAIDAIHSGDHKPDYWHDRLRTFLKKSSKQQIILGYVAVLEGEVVGYILAEGRAWEFGSPLCGWIFAIGVNPDCGRKGVGLALCQEVCRKFKSLGVNTVRTMVRRDDIDVLSFFRASGFRAGPFIELELEI